MKLTKTFSALAVAALLLPAITSRSAEAPSSADKEVCRKQLQTIYQAIQAYRRDHKDLPDWLSDLVPQYLADTNVLVCPITRRTGTTHPFQHLQDPKLPATYLYEFSPAPMGGIFGGGQIRMRDFKRRQMGYVGGEVPIVRCHVHQPVLNLAFSGHTYESSLNWEDNFTDVLDASTWEVENLFPEAGQMGRSVRPPARVPEQPAASDLVGRPAPAFTLPLLDGGSFDLAAYQDKDIVLLDFWATWCGPCRAAMPVLVAVAREYADKGVRYFAVNLREKPDVIRRYLEGAKLEIAVPLDKDGGVAKKYGVRGIPTMVIVDKEGVVRKVHVGSSPGLKTELKRTLDGLLGNKEAEATE